VHAEFLLDHTPALLVGCWLRRARERAVGERSERARLSSSASTKIKIRITLEIKIKIRGVLVTGLLG